MKAKAIIIQSAVDKQRDLMIMIAEIGPRESAPPSRIHPSQYETYDVLEGAAEFVLEAKSEEWSKARR